MPESRFVRAHRLRPLLAYFAIAVIGLLVADALIRALADDQGWRTVVAMAWLVLLPLGGWLVWRRG